MSLAIQNKLSESNKIMNLQTREQKQDDLSLKDVFTIMLRWIGRDKNQRKDKFMELFRHLRMIYISRDFLEGLS